MFRQRERERERKILTGFVWLSVNLGKHTDNTEKKNDWDIAIKDTPLMVGSGIVKIGCIHGQQFLEVGSETVNTRCIPSRQSRNN